MEHGNDFKGNFDSRIKHHHSNIDGVGKSKDKGDHSNDF